MNNFKGVIIEESLKNKDILNKVRIVSTKVEKVTERHKTPWLKKWTLHTVEIPEENIEQFAENISKEIRDNPSSWYTDFNNATVFYVVYPHKVFQWKKGEKEKVEVCKAYGISLGIPEYQVAFPI